MKRKLIFIAAILALSISFSACDAVKNSKENIDTDESIETSIEDEEIEYSKEEIHNWQKGAAKETINENLELVNDEEFVKNFGRYIKFSSVDYSKAYVFEITEEDIESNFINFCGEDFGYDNLSATGKESLAWAVTDSLTAFLTGISMNSSSRSYCSKNYYTCDYDINPEAWIYETDSEEQMVCVLFFKTNDVITVTSYSFDISSENFEARVENAREDRDMKLEYEVIENCDVDFTDTTVATAIDMDSKEWQMSISRERIDSMFELMSDEAFLTASAQRITKVQDTVSAAKNGSADFDKIYVFDLTSDVIQNINNEQFFDDFKFDKLSASAQEFLLSVMERNKFGPEIMDPEVYRTFYNMEVYSVDIDISNQFWVFDTDVEKLGICVYFLNVGDDMISVITCPFFIPAGSSFEQEISEFESNYNATATVQ